MGRSFLPAFSEPVSSSDVDDDGLAVASALRHEAAQVVSTEESEAGISSTQVTLLKVCLPSCLNGPFKPRSHLGFFKPQLALWPSPSSLGHKGRGQKTGLEL